MSAKQTRKSSELLSGMTPGQWVDNHVSIRDDHGNGTTNTGDEDPVHHHRDHLIYVLAGDEVTLTGEDGEPHAVPIAPGAGIPAPMSVPLMYKHNLKNSGKGPLKLLFFEMKK